MTTIQLKKYGVFQRSLKVVLGGGIAACLCTAVPAWATLNPLPMVCIDGGGTPSVTTSSLDEILVPGSTPIITYGLDTAEISFYVLPVFVPILGQRSVILTDGGVPTESVTLTVDQLVGKNSVDIFMETEGAANFDANIATLLGEGTPEVSETGADQDVSAALNVGENLMIGVNCSSVPDSGSTLALLALALAGVVMMCRRMPQSGNRSH